MSDTDGLDSAELLAAARLLLKGARDRQDSAHARRAVSTAYYAMFHCLARTCADRLASSRGIPLRPGTRQTVYRSLQHRQAKRHCQNQRLISAYPEAIRAFAEGFATLQDRRRRADYDPTGVFAPSVARESVDQAEEFIQALQEVPEADLRDFALRILLADREG